MKLRWFGGWRLQIRFVPPPPPPPHYTWDLESISRDYQPTTSPLGDLNKVKQRPPGWRPLLPEERNTLDVRRLADEDAVFFENMIDRLRGTPRKMAEAMRDVAHDPLTEAINEGIPLEEQDLTEIPCGVCWIGTTVPFHHDIPMCGACYSNLSDLPPIVKVASGDGVHRVWHFADGTTSQLTEARMIALPRTAIAPEVRLVRKVTV